MQMASWMFVCSERLEWRYMMIQVCIWCLLNVWCKIHGCLLVKQAINIWNTKRNIDDNQTNSIFVSSDFFFFFCHTHLYLCSSLQFVFRCEFCGCLVARQSWGLSLLSSITTVCTQTTAGHVGSVRETSMLQSRCLYAVQIHSFVHHGFRRALVGPELQPRRRHHQQPQRALAGLHARRLFSHCRAAR